MGEPCECGCGELANAGRRFIKNHHRPSEVPIHPAGMTYARALEIAMQFEPEVFREPTKRELTFRKREEDIRRLHALGYDDGEIAARTDVTHETVLRWRHKLGLPANSKGGRPQHYDPRFKDAKSDRQQRRSA